MPNTPTIPIEFQFDDANFKKLAAQMEKLYKDAQKFSEAIKMGNEVQKNNEKLKSTTKYMGDIVNLQNKHAIEAKKTGGVIGGLKLKVKQLNTALDGAMNPADVRKYNKELQKTKRALTEAKETTRGWGKALGSFQFKFNALGNIAANVASSITRGITRSLREALQTVIEFEKSFAAVLTLMTEAQKKEFGGLLKQNSVNLMKKYGLAIEDVNKATFDAVSAGIQMGDMFQFMDASAKLAVGGVTDLNASVKGLASILNAFNLEGSEAEDVASALFQAQRFGITYVDDMVKSMGRLNTIAKLTGTSYREMLAAFAAITKSGLNTEESVTGLRNVFKQLLGTTKETVTAIEFYNSKIDGLDIAYGVTALKQKGFINQLEELQKLYEAQPDAIAEVFGNIRGLTGATGLLGDNFERFIDIMNRVNDTQESQKSLNDAVEEQMTTLSKEIDVMKGTWQGFVLSVAEGRGIVGGTFELLIKLATKLGETLTEINPEMAVLKESIESGRVSAEAWFEATEKSADGNIETINRLIDAQVKLSQETVNRLKKEVAAYEESQVAAAKAGKIIPLRWLEGQAKIDREREIIEHKQKKGLIAYENAYIASLRSKQLANKETIVDIAEDDKEAQKEWLKLQKQRLKLEHELKVATITLYEDKFLKDIALANEEYDYQKKLANLEIQDRELLNIKLETIEKNHLIKIVAIHEKSAEQAATAWLEAFDFEDEDYIDDIPFDTEKVVAKLEKKKVDSLGDLLGISELNQEAFNEAIDAMLEFTDMMVELTERRIDAIQREINASDERTRSLQADRDHEWERMQEGYANNYALTQKELEDEKKRKAALKIQEQKALQDRKKAADAKIAIDTALQLSNLLVAATQIFASPSTSLPFGVGVAIAIAAIAAMSAAYLGFKANAADAVSLAEGEVDIQGAGTETSDSIPANLSRGESVIKAKATKPNKGTLQFMQDNPNHPMFRLLESNGVDNVFNKLSDGMANTWSILTGNDSSKWDELLYQEMRTHNDIMRNRPYSYNRGDKIITQEGNQITIAG